MMRRLVAVAATIIFLGCACGAAFGDDVAVTADAHRDDLPITTPAADTAPRMPVTGAALSYGSIDGSELVGYLARPVDGGPDTPGLIVIHEWWGLNDNIRKTAERLAGEGYVALAVDLYGGESAQVPKEAMRLMTELTQNSARADENLRQAYAYLDGRLGVSRVGSIGWCLGGRWSLRTAILLPDRLDAAVIYYGTVVTDPEQLAPLTMPVLGNFAGDDPIIPPDTVAAFEQAMKTLGKDVDIKVYTGAKHAFSNPSGLAYDAAAAADAWERTTAFLAAALKPD